MVLFVLSPHVIIYIMRIYKFDAEFKEELSSFAEKLLVGAARVLYTAALFSLVASLVLAYLS